MYDEISKSKTKYGSIASMNDGIKKGMDYILKNQGLRQKVKIIEDGDHSLSRDQDLKILFQTITELAL